MNLLIKNGQVIDPASGRKGLYDILIKEGKIETVGQDLQEDLGEIIDAHGMLVLPGLVDMHVHLREPGREDEETIESGTLSAARGGFTSVACMPNTDPAIDRGPLVEFIKAKALKEGSANVFPIGAVTKGRQGLELAEMAELYKAGAVAFSDDGNSIMKSDVMRRALEYSKIFDLPIIVHEEDMELATGGVMNEGSVSTKLGLKGIPKAAEEVMVARDIILAEMTGGRLHIAHVSTAGSVDLIKNAKERGIRVTCEVTPHHLTLTHQAVESFDTNTRVSPPLRTSQDIDALIEGLNDGTIDAIATDHAPHTREEKEVEYDKAPPGMIGLETALPLIMTQLVSKGRLEMEKMVELMTIGPAKILKIDKGSLEVGKDADITIVDPDMEITVRPEDFVSKSKNSPFIGWQLKGVPVATILGGRVVYMNRGVL
jgi:dihydroorotase